MEGVDLDAIGELAHGLETMEGEASRQLSEELAAGLELLASAPLSLEDEVLARTAACELTNAWLPVPSIQSNAGSVA